MPFVEQTKSRSSGVARQLVTFSCFAKEKVTKKKATPIRHLFEVPCVARLVRLPHKLARSATRPRAQTYSSEFPDQPVLLGGGTGEGKAKIKTTAWARCAHSTNLRSLLDRAPYFLDVNPIMRHYSIVLSMRRLWHGKNNYRNAICSYL
jgi:hypothetical protein